MPDQDPPTIIIPNIPKKRTIPPNCKRKHGQLAKKTLHALKLTAENGIAPEYALMLTNNGKVPTRYQTDSFKQKLEKYRLSHPRLAKLARNVVLETLRGDTKEITQQRIDKEGNVIDIKEVIAPSITNQLAAASMVYDRIDPVTHQNVNVNINADVSPVDLKRWINRAVDKG